MSNRRNLRASLIKSFRWCEFQAQEGHATAELSHVLPVHKVHTAVSGTADENSARKTEKKRTSAVHAPVVVGVHNPGLLSQFHYSGPHDAKLLSYHDTLNSYWTLIASLQQVCSASHSHKGPSQQPCLGQTVNHYSSIV